MGQRFTTSDVAAHERLAYWRDAICDVFVRLDCSAPRRRAFYGHVTMETLDRVRLSLVDADAQHVVRSRRQIGKSSEDDFLLSVQLDGSGLVRQDGRDAPLAADGMALYASTRPYELVFPRRFRQLVLQLPRDVLSAVVANPDALTARTLDSRLVENRILAGTLRALGTDAACVHAGARGHVARGLVQSLAASLATLPGGAVGAGFDRRSAARTRIQAYVVEHIDDPALSAAAIGAALGFSRQHVHRLFSGDESLERFVWRSRLERIRADLEQGVSDGIPLAELAARRGFSSPQHFSRAFRAEFGLTALEFRRTRRSDNDR